MGSANSTDENQAKQGSKSQKKLNFSGIYLEAFNQNCQRGNKIEDFLTMNVYLETNKSSMIYSSKFLVMSRFMRKN